MVSICSDFCFLERVKWWISSLKFTLFSLLSNLIPFLLLLCLCFLLPLPLSFCFKFSSSVLYHHLLSASFPPTNLSTYSFFSLSSPSLITNEDQSYFFFFIDFISIYNHLSVLLDPAVCQLLKFHPVNLIGTDSKYYWPHVMYSLLRCILCKYT